MQLNRAFGERARAWRKATGKSLTDLEREHGLNNRTFSALERGARTWSLHQIEAYCSALGVEPWRLFKWDEPLPEPRSVES
ncbi:MAG: helix-turn-helix domain-containing protein [Bradymonadia bacterium]